MKLLHPKQIHSLPGRGRGFPEFGAVSQFYRRSSKDLCTNQVSLQDNSFDLGIKKCFFVIRFGILYLISDVCSEGGGGSVVVKGDVEEGEDD